jgi:hypothetical protein
LRIGLDDNVFSLFSRHDLDGLTAHVTVPELTAFTLNGSGKADIGGLTGGTTKFMLDGSGDIMAKGKLDTVPCRQRFGHRQPFRLGGREGLGYGQWQRRRDGRSARNAGREHQWLRSGDLCP